MLRRKAKKLAIEKDCTLHIPKLAYCTDNAAMIAITGYMMAERGMFSDMNMKPFANLKALERMKS
jgi:N6-L-threonylcarbamoyladenine synthase